MTTKDKIIYEALTLFSMHGYEAVTVRQIASAVGIKESSIYNHFTSKLNILETIIEKTLQRYQSVLKQSNVPEVDDPLVSDHYDKIGDKDFYTMCTSIFMFYLKDDYISKLRRLLTIEQYSNTQLGDLFRTIFIDNVLDTQSQVLQKFIDTGRFIEGDAHTMALHFYGPIFMLLYKYDKDHTKEEQAIQELQNHVAQYNAIYIKK